jgi:hypothetical protein
MGRCVSVPDLNARDALLASARLLLHRQGRRVEELYYHTKVHPKTGEIAHLFRGKEGGRSHTKEKQPKNSTQSNTVRFSGVMNEQGVLVELREIGSGERKRIGRRGPVAGQAKVPHREQRIVRRDKAHKATESTRSPESGRGRTGRSETGSASPVSRTGPLENPTPQVARPTDPTPLAPTRERPE